jgi:uncharacterized protein (DUF362 family)
VPAGIATQVGLNAAFYLFLARRRGWGFAVGAIPLHYLYYCCCGVSVLIALTLWHLSNRRTSATATKPDLLAAPEVAAPASVRLDAAEPVAIASRPYIPRAREADPVDSTLNATATESATVAVVRGTSRRGAVAEALALIADDLRARVAPEVLVKPNLVSHRDQLASTHADTLSATLDALLAAGATRITVAEGASDATAGFARFGFDREAFGRPVRFLDLNRDETEWEPLELLGVDGSTRIARVSRTIASSPCRVSLALAKTHVTSMVTLSLKNMLSSIHPFDRVMMHGHAGGGNGYRGWKRWVVELLKQDNPAVKGLTRLMGRVRNGQNALRTLAGRDTFETLSAPERAFLHSVEAMNRNLVALARRTKPHLSVVDGFVGMHREGPRHGTPIKLGVVIAGTDAVAVDAVAAAVMGFDPGAIGYLHYAGAAGLGVTDLEAIRVVGDPIASVRRRFVPHSNHSVQKHWHRLAASEREPLRGPHFATSGTPTERNAAR